MKYSFQESRTSRAFRILRTSLIFFGFLFLIGGVVYVFSVFYFLFRGEEASFSGGVGVESGTNNITDRTDNNALDQKKDQNTQNGQGNKNNRESQVNIGIKSDDLTLESDQQRTLIFDFVPPIDRVSERVSLKKFGTFVTPENSPVSPERFSGYHTGIDFEIFEDELLVDVPVLAVCSGTVRFVSWVSGYGGVVVLLCEYQNEPVTVVYGHLNLASVKKNVGDVVEKGESLSFLGVGGSAETDGERKHLHLSIHKGIAQNLRGYVSTKDDLSSWIDPCELWCKD